MKEQIEHGKVNLPRPRKLKYWAFIVFLALLSSCQGERRTISVSGEGRVTFVPDTVSFTITVRNLSPTLKEATRDRREGYRDGLCKFRKGICQPIWQWRA